MKEKSFLLSLQQSLYTTSGSNTKSLRRVYVFFLTLCLPRTGATTSHSQANQLQGTEQKTQEAFQKSQLLTCHEYLLTNVR